MKVEEHGHDGFTRRCSARIELRTALAPKVVRDHINAAIREKSSLRGIAFEDRIEFTVGDNSHFWSPQIVATVQPAEDGGSILACRFGPDPYVWALYLLLYGTILALSCFALLFGLVQWSIGQKPMAMYLAPFGLVLGGLVYGASFVGQGLGSDQMYFLRAELTRITEATETT